MYALISAAHGIILDLAKFLTAKKQGRCCGRSKLAVKQGRLGWSTVQPVPPLFLSSFCPPSLPSSFFSSFIQVACTIHVRAGLWDIYAPC